MRFDHPIFAGPLAVDRTTETKADPVTGETIEAWRVQEDHDEPGLVASRKHFVGAPDSEIVSGGVNLKGRRGVPLVREGNIFLWGFSAAPDTMTDGGRAAFVNAIAYIARFDGQVPTRRDGVAARASWRGVIESPYVKPERLPRYFGPSLVAAHGDDKAAYAKDLEVREPYLFVARGSANLRIDHDAEALGHPTNSLDLIRAAIAEGGARGARILDRYWPEDDLVVARPGTPEGLDAISGDVVFTEMHGYRWISQPAASAPEDWVLDDALAQLIGPDPSEVAPAMFSARGVGGYNSESHAHVDRFEAATVAVRAEVLEGWHLTLGSADSAITSVAIELDLPEGVAWIEDEFEIEGPTEVLEGALTGHGTLVWTRDVWVTAEPGDHEIQGTVRFQVCDVESCLPPMDAQVTMELRVR